MQASPATGRKVPHSCQGASDFAFPTFFPQETGFCRTRPTLRSHSAHPGPERPFGPALTGQPHRAAGAPHGPRARRALHPLPGATGGGRVRGSPLAQRSRRPRSSAPCAAQRPSAAARPGGPSAFPPPIGLPHPGGTSALGGAAPAAPRSPPPPRRSGLTGLTGLRRPHQARLGQAGPGRAAAAGQGRAGRTHACGPRPPSRRRASRPAAAAGCPATGSPWRRRRRRPPSRSVPSLPFLPVAAANVTASGQAPPPPPRPRLQLSGPALTPPPGPRPRPLRQGRGQGPSRRSAPRSRPPGQGRGGRRLPLQRFPRAAFAPCQKISSKCEGSLPQHPSGRPGRGFGFIYCMFLTRWLRSKPRMRGAVSTRLPHGKLWSLWQQHLLPTAQGAGSHPQAWSHRCTGEFIIVQDHLLGGPGAARALCSKRTPLLHPNPWPSRPSDDLKS